MLIVRPSLTCVEFPALYNIVTGTPAVTDVMTDEKNKVED